MRACIQYAQRKSLGQILGFWSVRETRDANVSRPVAGNGSGRKVCVAETGSAGKAEKVHGQEKFNATR